MISLLLESICLDGGTQPRAALDESTISKMCRDLRDGHQFPPVLVFIDDDHAHWLVDGFHRVTAAKNIGRDGITAEVTKGSRRDAFLKALELNAGKPLTPADRAACVGRMLTDDEWSKWSDREIGRRCGVAPNTVGAMRRQLNASAQIAQMQKHPEPQVKEEPMAEKPKSTGATVTPIRPEVTAAPVLAAPTKRKATRNGKTYEVNVDNIGASPRSRPRSRVSLKARAILDSANLKLDQKQTAKLGALSGRMQIMIAQRLKAGESVTIADAVEAITSGAPVDGWGRAWDAIKALPVEDQRRLCRTVLRDLGEQVTG